MVEPQSRNLDCRSKISVDLDIDALQGGAPSDATKHLCVYVLYLLGCHIWALGWLYPLGRGGGVEVHCFLFVQRLLASEARDYIYLVTN